MSKLRTLSFVFVLACQDTASDLCFRAPEFLYRSQVLPRLPFKTLYPFAGNPRGFCWKPYTLLSETHEGFAGNPIPFCRGDRYRTEVDKYSAGSRSGVSGAGMPVLHRVFRYIRIWLYVEDVWLDGVCKSKNVPWYIGVRKP